MPRVERAWREASRGQRRLRALLDNVREGVLALCPEGRITYANATAAALLRRDPPEFVGLDANDLQALPRDMRPGAAGSADVDTFLRADGSGLPVEWRCTELDDGSRVLVFRDATERMRMRLERDILRRRSDPPRSRPAGHASGRVVFIHGDACARASVGEELDRIGWAVSLAENVHAALDERSTGLDCRSMVHGSAAPPHAALLLVSTPEAALLHGLHAALADVPVMLVVADVPGTDHEAVGVPRAT